MFNLGFFEIIFIVVIALIFIGPDKMPELAKNIGKMIRDLKKATNEVTDTFQREAHRMTDEKETLKTEIKNAVDLKFIAEDSSVPTEKTSKTSSDEPKGSV